ncbi:EamA family transporter [Leucobacter chironomi]|uniref:EamA family transporter n=1 Tax=Leucobacter chironomi TaxID=491918 RepID=UPI00040328AE|nr:EamA family transporter [Leucobacter chironomi]
MPLSALLLVLAAAITHAAWNIIAHGSSRSGLPFLWWGSVASALLWAVAVPFTGGLGSASAGAFLLGVGVSGALHVLYMLVLQRGYARGELSTVYATARGTAPILTVLVAVALLGERPGPGALVGVALVIGGVAAFGIVSRPGPGLRRRGVDPGLGYGLLTGVAIAAYTVWDARAVSGMGIAPVAFMVGCSLAEIPFFTAMLLLERRGGALARLRDELRSNAVRLLAFGVLSPLAYVLVLTAVTLAPVSLVAPVREVSVVLVGLYGAIRHRESRPLLRLLAAGIVVAGVLLVAL